jgi:hypothetical protein
MRAVSLLKRGGYMSYDKRVGIKKRDRYKGKILVAAVRITDLQRFYRGDPGNRRQWKGFLAEQAGIWTLPTEGKPVYRVYTGYLRIYGDK